jgi:hypothetical protein
MLEIIYTLRLGQLLKITPNLKRYMWQKLKPKKPNINAKHISKPSVAILVKTHSKLDITSIEVDNHMVVIQVQVGKSIVEDVLINEGASVNIITKKFQNKIRFTQTKINSIPP